MQPLSVIRLVRNSEHRGMLLFRLGSERDMRASQASQNLPNYRCRELVSGIFRSADRQGHITAPAPRSLDMKRLSANCRCLRMRLANRMVTKPSGRLAACRHWILAPPCAALIFRGRRPCAERRSDGPDDPSRVGTGTTGLADLAGLAAVREAVPREHLEDTETLSVRDPGRSTSLRLS